MNRRPNAHLQKTTATRVGRAPVHANLSIPQSKRSDSRAGSQGRQVSPKPTTNNCPLEFGQMSKRFKQHTQNEKFIGSFEQEKKVLETLKSNHKGIVKLLKDVQVGPEEKYFIMEHICGKNLGDVVRDIRNGYTLSK